MDRNYRATAHKIGHTIDKVSGDDLDNFPIEIARTRGSWYVLVVYLGALAGHGWSVQSHAHESVPMILQFLLVALRASFQQTLNALLVDIFPASPSTAAASSNITRCALSAVAIALGRGWFFALLALVSGGGGLLTNLAINTRGMRWRLQRLSKSENVLGKDEAVETKTESCVRR